MARVILFSGGVESTALLTMADRDDLLLVCEVPFKDYKPGYNLDTCRKIAKRYGMQLVTFSCGLQFNRTEWLHQLNWLLMAANLVVKGSKNYTEVWIGLQPKDVEAQYKQSIYGQMFGMWEVLNPEVMLRAPMRHLTKKMQWKLIPDDIKSLVNSCSEGTNCGTCRKCEEFKTGIA